MVNQITRTTVILASAVAVLTGCSKGSTSYSLLNDGQGYKQQAVLIPKKIDVLWVIDNSGSMATSQNNLASNFQSFIQRFQAQNHDFHMGVVTTDGWMRQFDAASEKARLRDGAKIGSTTTSSGVFVMNSTTPDLANVFSINAKQHINGNGDERAFESFKQSLMDPFNVAFRRPDAFLAVIIVSDEEDFSHNTSSLKDGTYGENPYTNPGLYSVQSYINFLDTYTDKTVNGKNYSVSAITVPDAACKAQLSTDGFTRKIATRVQELASLTAGVNGSLCSNFGETLELISASIIQLSSSFKLGREPQEDTISVVVDNISIPKDSVNGWTYDAASLTITFHGSAVPAPNANIRIDYYPKSINL